MQDLNPRPPPGREDLGPLLTVLDRMADAEDERRRNPELYKLDGDPEVVKYIAQHYDLYDCAGTGKTKIELDKNEHGIHTRAIFADKVERSGDFLKFYRNGEISGEIADINLRSLDGSDPPRDIEKEVEEIEAIEKELGRSTVHEELGWKQRGMKLLTQADRKKLPKLYETEGVPPEDKILRVKFFTPTSNWTWYASEFDGEDTFFGYVEGMENEWGYFSLKELSDVKGPYGVGVERDKYWEPTKFGDYIARKG